MPSPAWTVTLVGAVAATQLAGRVAVAGVELEIRGRDRARQLGDVDHDAVERGRPSAIAEPGVADVVVERGRPAGQEGFFVGGDGVVVVAVVEVGAVVEDVAIDHLDRVTVENGAHTWRIRQSRVTGCIG